MIYVQAFNPMCPPPLLMYLADAGKKGINFIRARSAAHMPFFPVQGRYSLYRPFPVRPRTGAVRAGTGFTAPV